MNIVESYQRHKNLKLAANELGMKWQTLYVQLRNKGVNIIGDKSRYGADSDKLAALAERYFKESVPYAIDQNEIQFQAKFDFDVRGYKTDIKSSNLNIGNRMNNSKRWAFCIKKQSFIADFFVCFAFIENKLEKVFLMPGEIVSGKRTISVSDTGKSKWDQYEVSISDLKEFFDSLPEQSIK